MVVHACNSTTQEADAGGLQVQKQPEIYSETLSRKISRALVAPVCNPTY
jgi:hypothetical protein